MVLMVNSSWVVMVVIMNYGKPTEFQVSAYI